MSYDAFASVLNYQLKHPENDQNINLTHLSLQREGSHVKAHTVGFSRKQKINLKSLFTFF